MGSLVIRSSKNHFPSFQSPWVGARTPWRLYCVLSESLVQKWFPCVFCHNFLISRDYFLWLFSLECLPEFQTHSDASSFILADWCRALGNHLWAPCLVLLNQDTAYRLGGEISFLCPFLVVTSSLHISGSLVVALAPLRSRSVHLPCCVSRDSASLRLSLFKNHIFPRIHL